MPDEGNGRSASEWASAFRTALKQQHQLAKGSSGNAGLLQTPAVQSMISALGFMTARGARATEQLLLRRLDPDSSSNSHDDDRGTSGTNFSRSGPRALGFSDEAHRLDGARGRGHRGEIASPAMESVEEERLRSSTSGRSRSLRRESLSMPATAGEERRRSAGGSLAPINGAAAASAASAFNTPKEPLTGSPKLS